jgi:hypothetical protein
MSPKLAAAADSVKIIVGIDQNTGWHICPVGKVGVFFIAAQILEWQHRDRFSGMGGVSITAEEASLPAAGGS